MTPEAIAEMKLVGKLASTHTVTLGWAKEPFVVTDEGCSCGEKDCLHIRSVAYAIEHGLVTDGQEVAKSNETFAPAATPRQLNAINVLAASRGTYVDVQGFTGAQASEVIRELKSK
jgi:hypothetical protein